VLSHLSWLEKPSFFPTKKIYGSILGHLHQVEPALQRPLRRGLRLLRLHAAGHRRHLQLGAGERKWMGEGDGKAMEMENWLIWLVVWNLFYFSIYWE
jgi:hypothetical protein